MRPWFFLSAVAAVASALSGPSHVPRYPSLKPPRDLSQNPVTLREVTHLYKEVGGIAVLREPHELPLEKHGPRLLSDPLNPPLIEKADITSPVNGVLQTDRLVEATCTYANWALGAAPRFFSITNAVTGRSWIMTLRCPPPEHIMTNTRITYVPTNVSVDLAEYCETQDIVAPDSPISSILRPKELAGRLKARMLYAAARSMRDTLVRSSHITARMKGITEELQANDAYHTVEHHAIVQSMISDVLHRRRSGFDLQGFGDFFQRTLCYGGVGTSFGTGIIGNVIATGAGLCGGPNFDDLFNGIKASIDNLNRTQQQTLDNIEKLFANETLLDQKIAENFDIYAQFASQTTVQFQDVFTQINGTIRQNSILKNMYDGLNDWARKNANETGQQIGDLYTRTEEANQAISALGNLTSAALTSVTRQLNVNLNLTLARLSALDAELQLLWSQLVKDSTLIGFQLRSVATNLGNFKISLYPQRYLGPLMHSYIDAAEARGEVPQITSRGQRAALARGTTRPFVIFRIRYFQAALPFVGREDEIQVLCDIDFTIRNLQGSPNFADVIAAIGPDGCTPGVTCLCYIKWQWSTGCTTSNSITGWPSPPGTGSNYFKKKTSQWFVSAQYNTSMCQGTGFRVEPTDGSGNPSPRIVSNSSGIVDMFQTIGSNAFNFGEETYVAYAAPMGIVRYVRWSDQSALKITDIMRPPSFGDVPGLFTLYLNIAMMTLQSQIPALIKLVDGVAPSFSYYEYKLTPIGNSTGTCHQGAIASTSGVYTPVYRAVYLSTTAAANVTIQSTTNASDVRVFTAFSSDTSAARNGLLPSVLYYVGPVDGDEAGRVYDVPESQISVSNSAVGDRGKVTYLRCDYNVPEACTPVQWAARNANMHIDAFDASNSAALYAGTLVSAAGRRGLVCSATSTRSDLSSMCALRNDFDVSYTDETRAFMSLKPVSAGSYPTTFRIPIGTTAELSGSFCPLVSVQESTSTTLRLRITNANPEAVSVLLYLSSPCCTVPGPSQVNVAARDTLILPVTPCTASCRLLQATFARLDGTQCDGTPVFNLTTPTYSQAVLQIPSDVRIFYASVTKVSVDTVYANVLRVVSNLAGYLSDLAVLNGRQVKEINLADVSAFDYVREIDRIANGANSAAAAAAAARAAAQNSTKTSLEDLESQDDAAQEEWETVTAQLAAGQIRLAAGLEAINQTASQALVLGMDFRAIANDVAVMRNLTYLGFRDLFNASLDTTVRLFNGLQMIANALPGNGEGYGPLADLGRALVGSIAAGVTAAGDAAAFIAGLPAGVIDAFKSLLDAVLDALPRLDFSIGEVAVFIALGILSCLSCAIAVKAYQKSHNGYTVVSPNK